MLYSLVCVEIRRQSRFPSLIFQYAIQHHLINVSIYLFMYTFFIQRFKKTYFMSRAMRKPVFAYAKRKTQISCAVTTADLRLCFRHIDSTIALLLKCQASIHLMRFYSSVTPMTGFLMIRLSYKTIIGQRNKRLSE